MVFRGGQCWRCLRLRSSPQILLRSVPSWLDQLSVTKPRPIDRSKDTCGCNTIDKGNYRSKATKDMYEMTVVEDDVSSVMTVQPPNVNDDEARLWRGPQSGSVRASASSNPPHVQTPALRRDSEAKSIYVTSETTVEYGDR